MVALNFQTSDMPMQVNYAKFEMNGGTGSVNSIVLSIYIYVYIDVGFNVTMVYGYWYNRCTCAFILCNRYILKPSVMCMEKGFNPFVQKKIEDTVPARLSIKIISGMFITSKKTDLMVEVEMYGLPADIVRRQFTKKRAPAPNPFWDEDYFVFRRVSSVFIQALWSYIHVHCIWLIVHTYVLEFQNACTYSTYTMCFTFSHFRSCYLS